MQFRSINDLSVVITTNLHRIPRDIDVVVGIPRSGMLPASILALAINKPLSDLETFASGGIYRSGTTRGQQNIDALKIKRVLIVDDSIRTGGSMRKARDRIKGAAAECIFMAVFGTGDHTDVDLVLENVPEPRAFEWNVFHHPGFLAHMCFDIDGILCVDPSSRENDDGEKYRSFIQNAAPRFLPSGRVKAVVSSRLEKYRRETEDWLSRVGIEYDELHLLDLPDAETRRRLGSHAKFKAEIYSKCTANLFVESERWQAVEIARRSGKQVLLMGNSGPELFSGRLINPRGFYWRLRQSYILRRLKRFVSSNRPWIQR